MYRLNMHSKQNGKIGRIEIVLSGGLGNQLFGWAACRTLADSTQGSIVLNTAQLHGRQFELDAFTHLEHERVSKSYYSYRTRNRFTKKIWIILNSSAHFFERKFSYQALPVQSHLVLHGYFQSYKYFWDNLHKIQSSLAILNGPSAEYIKLMKDLDHDFIAIHVRRGDYSNKGSIHRVLDGNYYQRATELLPSDLVNCQKVVFSDDIDYAKKVVSADRYISDVELPSPAENLKLMSSGSALIGANSSFSLWAGFLMEGTSKVRIFPKEWFVDDRIITDDMMPESFMRV